MVMTRPPALHVCKFLMKNMIPTNSGLMLDREFTQMPCTTKIAFFTDSYVFC